MSFGTSPVELLATDAMLRGLIFANAYTYNADFLAGTNQAIPASATSVQQVVQITSEADFVVQQLSAITWSAAGTLLQDPDYTIQIAISSGRPWFNAPLSVRNVSGMYAAAELPIPLPFPRLIPLNSTLTVTVTNRTAVAANFFQLALIGFNVYYQPGGNRQSVFHAL
jgi:hypothetical protein